MTASPEDPDGVYLAGENASKLANTNLCLRFGCTRWRTVATPAPVESLDPINAAKIIGQRHIKFVSQLSEDVPCAPAAPQKIPVLLPPTAEGKVWLVVRCGQVGNFDRDCLNDAREMTSYVEALQAGQVWAFRAPRYYEVFDRPGGQLIARGTGY